MEREGTPDSLHHIPNGEPEPTVMAEQLQVSIIMITLALSQENLSSRFLVR